MDVENCFPDDLVRMKACLLVAKAIQENLLPHQPPCVEGLDVSGRSVYSGLIGGDYFDYMDYSEVCCRSPEHIATVVGDVSGHGVSAALLMATIRAYIRCRVTYPGDLGEVMTDVNRLVVKDLEASGHFMTLFYLDINRKHGELSWVRAGHEPAWLYDPATDRFEILMGKGKALGVDPTTIYPVNFRSGLKEGEVILIGTDGIWETRDPGGCMFGKERLKTLIRENHRKSSAAIIATVIDSLAAFRKDARPEDDASLVVVKIVP